MFVTTEMQVAPPTRRMNGMFGLGAYGVDCAAQGRLDNPAFMGFDAPGPSVPPCIVSAAEQQAEAAAAALDPTYGLVRRERLNLTQEEMDANRAAVEAAGALPLPLLIGGGLVVAGVFAWALLS